MEIKPYGSEPIFVKKIEDLPIEQQALLDMAQDDKYVTCEEDGTIDEFNLPYEITFNESEVRNPSLNIKIVKSET